MRTDRLETATQILDRFAERTGLTSDRTPQRYLWTDALAVCTWLGLARATHERRYVDLALRLVDAVHPTSRFKEAVAKRVAQLAAASDRPQSGAGIALHALDPELSDTVIAYRHVSLRLERERRVGHLTVRAPAGEQPSTLQQIHAAGDDWWPLRAFRELDDVLHDRHGTIVEFMAHFHRLVARAVNAHRGRWENLWASEPPCLVELVTIDDVVDKVVYDLPDGFYESFVPQALATDAAGIQKAARAAIDPRRLVLVVVGDRAKVEAPLEALNLGALRILSVDDVMGKAPAIE